jgi:hypothetical protein
MKRKAEDYLFNIKDLIFSYTRQDALDDGILIDVSYLAIELGIKIPCAITCDLYHSYLETEITGQDEVGRTWDMLNVFRYYARGVEEDTILFPVLFQMMHEVEQVIVKAVIGPGDDGEAVLTFMMPEED